MAYSRVIEDLGLVLKISNNSSQILLAGWTESGLPSITTNADYLSDQAKLDFQAFSRSGYPIPRLQVGREVEAVSIQFADQIQDLKDPSPSRLVQDTVKINILTSDGESKDIVLGELEILNMIGNMMISFQRFGSVLDSPDRQEAVEYFSFFLPGIEYDSRDSVGDSRPSMLMLIKPTNKNVGNMVDVVLFASDVIKKLVLNDSRQPPSFKKGYRQVQGEVEKVMEKQRKRAKGLFGYLFVPEDYQSPLVSFIKDIVMVPADGSKPKNPFLVPVKKKHEFDQPTRENLLGLRQMAVKMFDLARSRIK